MFEGDDPLEPRIEAILPAISKVIDYIPDGRIESNSERCIARWHIERNPKSAETVDGQSDLNVDDL